MAEEKYAITGNLLTVVGNKLRSYATSPNLIPTSTDAMGSIYNGIGYKYGVRLNSSGQDNSDGAAYGLSATGYIACSTGDIFELVGFAKDAEYGLGSVCVYDSNKTFIVKDLWNEVYSAYTISTANAGYVRFCAVFNGESAEVTKGGMGDTYTLGEMPSAIDGVYNKGYADGIEAATPTLQDKTFTPTKAGATLTPDAGFDGLSSVVVNGDNNFIEENIAQGVTIWGKTGTHSGGITPSGTKTIIANGTFDVTAFANVIVNVPSAQQGTFEVTTDSANITIPIDGSNISLFLLYRPETSYSASVVGFFLRMPQGSCLSGRLSHSSQSWTLKSDGTATISATSIALHETSGFGFTHGLYKWIAL